MNIAGIVKSSFIDYPGRASTVIFLGGCNLNCGYCHNPEIVYCREGSISLPDFFAFLEKRKKFLDAVCISGGEPTIHRELYDLTVQIKALGYGIKLDTNGTNPTVLRRLIEEGLVDHVAMDVKGPWEKYGQIALREKVSDGEASVGKTAELVRESLQVLLDQGGKITWELRTTVCRELLREADIAVMARQLAGAPLWYLQTLKQQGQLLDQEGSYSAYTPAEMESLCSAARLAEHCLQVRVR